MKFAPTIITLFAAGIGTYLAFHSASVPLVDQSFRPPTLIWTNPPPSQMQIIWNDFTRTNFTWWCEVADDPAGPWRYPDVPQFPDESNWVVHLGGASFIRLRGIPN